MGMGDIANTGMQASMSNMSVISNNIANASTYAFKRSTTNFSDLFPSGNASAASIGLGVKLVGVQQDFSTGGPQATPYASDLSINGNGFFIMKDQTSGISTYTRYGHFNFNETTGFFMLGNQRLQGFPATNGSVPAGSSPQDLFVNTSQINATPSTTVTESQLNLNPSDHVPIDAIFAPTDVNSYNFVTSANLYDSLGSSNKLQLYYIKSATNNTWTVNAYVNGTSVGQGTMTFNPTNGQLASATGLSNLSFNPTSGAASPQVFSISMTGATQTGTSYNANNFTVNGSGAGTYSGFTVDDNGLVTAQYSNGSSVVQGQIAIANFQSPQGLQDQGNMSFTPTSTSGLPIVNQSNSAGNISQGTLELSNVDMATELVNLINAQNTFQANAQVEQAYIQVMQTVTKL